MPYKQYRLSYEYQTYVISVYMFIKTILDPYPPDFFSNLSPFTVPITLSKPLLLDRLLLQLRARAPTPTPHVFKRFFFIGDPFFPLFKHLMCQGTQNIASK